MTELQFKFVDYRLFKLQFTIKDVRPSNNTVEVNQVMNCNFKYQANRAEVYLDIRLDGDRSPFLIEIAYVGIFDFNQDLDTIEVEKRRKIIHVNCAAILYPFIRETIAETTRKAGFPPLLLSSFNFIKAFEENQKLIEGSKL